MKKKKKLEELMYKIEKECTDCSEILKISSAHGYYKLKKEEQILQRKLYNRGPWFFLQYKKVKGYLGSERSMFISLQPSTGTFDPSTANFVNSVGKYYNAIERYNENAHLTDLVKCRGKTKEVEEIQKQMAEKCVKYLMEELRITKPTEIFLIGKDVQANEVLKSSLKKYKKDIVKGRWRIYIYYFVHYAQTSKKNKKKAEDQYDKLKKKEIKEFECTDYFDKK